MKANVLLFTNFETLDVFGPVEILGQVLGAELDYFSLEGGEVESKDGVKVVTEPLSKADPANILLLPGGPGTRSLVNDREFIQRLKSIAIVSSNCLSVCTGSALLAKTGLLDGLQATSNKKAFEWVKSVNEKVDWVHQARWVTAGKYYTSSGVSAGMDMTLGFISDQLGKATAEEIARTIEYEWNPDSDKDLFAQ